ncbi:NlpC/P60 family protein [Actinomyces marmotae]|uniref:NlpC/P60 domain-containing protein n=1 Tax=Actinomyces marmotae TaxID=2737173 RepID=A0A6M8B730_9ACTO|nr:NlpC/P60 family protein [Actinomyces marmotae]QKD80380.1 hypothetical protein HPC72_09315 [Actinomyces marmotae]
MHWTRSAARRLAAAGLAAALALPLAAQASAVDDPGATPSPSAPASTTGPGAGNRLGPAPSEGRPDAGATPSAIDPGAAGPAAVAPRPEEPQAAAVPAIAPSSVNPAGAWVKADWRWWWRNPDGTFPRSQCAPIDYAIYCFDAEGYMRTGWWKDDAGWHYNRDSGTQYTGWLKDRGHWYYLDPSSGVMSTGSLTVDGARYYLAADGAMALGWIKHADGWRYYTPSTGAMATGWLGLDEWYYMDPSSGIMATGSRNIDGKTYWFYDSGAWWAYWAPSWFLQPTKTITPLNGASNNLTIGMNGVKVRIVQQSLGLWSPSKLASVDDALMSAVANFQSRAGLPATGVVDKATWDALGTGYDWFAIEDHHATPIRLSATRSERIEAMIGYAQDQIGSSYTWGGAGPYGLGYDCSGLVLQSLYAGGLDPQPINTHRHAWPDYRTSQELFRHPRMQHVPLSQRQRGDLIFYVDGSGTITHVAIYLGGDQVVHTDWMGRPARIQHITVGYGWSGMVGEVVRPFPEN